MSKYIDAEKFLKYLGVCDDVVSGSSSAFDKGMVNMIRRIRKLVESGDFDTDRWISVKERLPAVGETVLIYYRYHDQQSIVTARFVNGGFIGFWDVDVTHWQSLPEPPKEGENG